MDAEANVGNDAVPAGKSFDKMTDEESKMDAMMQRWIT